MRCLKSNRTPINSSGIKMVPHENVLINEDIDGANQTIPSSIFDGAVSHLMTLFEAIRAAQQCPASNECNGVAGFDSAFLPRNSRARVNSPRHCGDGFRRIPKQFDFRRWPPKFGKATWRMFFK